MQTFETYNHVDFDLYKQVLRGAFNPVTITKSAFKSSFSLVRSANSCVVCSSKSKDKVTTFVSSNNFKTFGYHSTDDFEISFVEDPVKNVHKALIKPRIAYTLKEAIYLPIPPDDKAKFFMDLFSDEFERVKIRAEHRMYGALSDEMLRSHAVRNLQLLKKLFNDSRFSFNSLCSGSGNTGNQSDLFIFYVLNLFIIRSIVFYSEFFNPYLNEIPLAEFELRDSFHKDIPHIIKYPWLFNHRPPFYEIIGDFINASPLNESNPIYLQNIDIIKPYIPEALHKEAIDIIELRNSAQLNCNTNIFIDVIFQFLYNKNPEGKSLLDAEPSNVGKVLSFFLTDKNGSPLNIESVKTMLKPSNSKKRPHKDDKRKINIL